VFELKFSISILWSRGSLQRLLCRLILLVSVVAFVREPLVGVVGVGTLCAGDMPKECRFREGMGIGEGPSESDGVPPVRCIHTAGSSPTSRTCSRSGFRWDGESWRSYV
jgi:hypothetical protein